MIVLNSNLNWEKKNFEERKGKYFFLDLEYSEIQVMEKIKSLIG